MGFPRLWNFTTIFPVCFTEALEVNDLALTQELDRVAYIGVVDQAQQVIVSCARFLLWCMADGTT